MSRLHVKLASTKFKSAGFQPVVIQSKAETMKTIAGRILMVITAALLCRGVSAEDRGWVDLLKQGDMSAWKEPLGEWKTISDEVRLSDDGKNILSQEGRKAVLNGDKGNTRDLYTKAEYGDVELHVEFLISRRSNSGVYLMGRYEIQIYDSFGVDKDKYPGIECGGIYPRWINNQNIEGHSPLVNAALEPGKWQTFDITFRAPRFDDKGSNTANAVFVKVMHNGKVIHENVQLTGPTRGGYDGEKAVGPLRLQGDHGPVAYRNIRIRRLEGDTARH